MSNAWPDPLPSDGTPALEPDLSGIRTSYLDLFYATLFHPVRTFRLIGAEKTPGHRFLVYALLTVILISTAVPVVNIATRGGKPESLILLMPFHAVEGVLIWAFMALVISMLSFAFSGQARLRSFLVLSGLATLPWIFMGPISLLKIGLGVTGTILATILGMTVWLWTIMLFALAMVVAFEMSAERVMIVLVMPFVMLLVFTGWIIGFIQNIRILSPFH